MSKGYAFVNFITPASMSSFAQLWHGSWRFGYEALAPINISIAQVQGFEENLKRIGKNRCLRVRNPHLRPFIATKSKSAESTTTRAGSSSAAVPCTELSDIASL